MGQRVVPRNVTLYPRDWNIIKQADNNDAGVSATLRRIVREWHESRQAPRPEPEREAEDE